MECQAELHTLALPYCQSFGGVDNNLETRRLPWQFHQYSKDSLCLFGIKKRTLAPVV
jgi:hypothetical protein